VPSTVPSVSGAKVVKALESAGYEVARITGSHHIMKHPDRPTVTVPVHAGRDVLKTTLRGILNAAGITPDEVRALL
jgi:predicted RNA binding protein YcfA (HicA-like mRNA interferase family)